MKSHFLTFLQLVVFCIVLTVGFDTERLVVLPPTTAYADQISEVEEAEASDENSDSDSESDNAGNENDEENSDYSADEAKDSNMDSNDSANANADSDSDFDTEEDTNSESEDKSEYISEDTNTSVDSEPEEVKSNEEDEVEQFELSDKTGHVEEIRFSRPVKETAAPTEAETVEHTEPETEQETEPETQPETQEETQEETTQEETAPESVAETQPETIPDTETVAETEAVKEVPRISHSTHEGGITTYDNSEMDYINNPETPVVVVEEEIPEPKAIEVQQPEITLTEHRSTPKTGESDDLYLLTSCILILFALILNAPSFYGKTGATLSKEVKSINREDSLKALGLTATRANCRTRRSRRMQKRALAFLAFGQTLI